MLPPFAWTDHQQILATTLEKSIGGCFLILRFVPELFLGSRLLISPPLYLIPINLSTTEQLQFPNIGVKMSPGVIHSTEEASNGTDSFLYKSQKAHSIQAVTPNFLNERIPDQHPFPYCTYNTVCTYCTYNFGVQSAFGFSKLLNTNKVISHCKNWVVLK